MNEQSQWADAPTGDGWYWLEQLGEFGPPVYVMAGVTGGASWVFAIGTTCWPVRGRVFRITDRPQASVAERIVNGLEQFVDDMKRGEA